MTPLIKILVIQKMNRNAPKFSKIKIAMMNKIISKMIKINNKMIKNNRINNSNKHNSNNYKVLEHT